MSRPQAKRRLRNIPFLFNPERVPNSGCSPYTIRPPSSAISEAVWEDAMTEGNELAGGTGLWAGAQHN